MQDAQIIERIRRKFLALAPVLDERSRRHWAAVEANELAWGGVTSVAAATGLSRTTITSGLRELREQSAGAAPTQRIRRLGGGRKHLEVTDPGLWDALDDLIDPVTRGDPESPLRWTCKSTRRLARELCRQGHPISDRTVAALLIEMGYSLQANRETREGSSHPDRNAQFEYINAQVRRLQKRGQPVVSVDTKKKELVGAFKNGGREGQPHGEPEDVRIHDFQDKPLGKAIPYGVYDLANKQGWVSVGIDHDTAYFAARTIRRWYEDMGSDRFPRAQEVLITADGGGSNSCRSRLWKVALQELLAQGHAEEEVPSERTLRDILNRMNYRLKRIQKGKPLTKTKDTDAIVANLQEVRKQVRGDPETLEISMDTKTKVGLGDYARGGKNPDEVGRHDGERLGS